MSLEMRVRLIYIHISDILLLKPTQEIMYNVLKISRINENNC